MKPAAAPTSAVTCVGTATPMVSAIAISSGLPAASRSASATTRAAGTSPSKGQPNAVEIVTCARIPAPRAASAISSQVVDALVDAAALIPLAEAFTGGDRHANLGATGGARTIETLAIQHQADDTAHSGAGASAASTASASAICGTRFGFTKLATSIRRSPARSRRRTNSTFVGGRQHLRLALQAVSRPDFDDLDVHGNPWREL